MKSFAYSCGLLWLVLVVQGNEGGLVRKELESVKWNKQLSDLHTMGWHLPNTSYPANYDLQFNLTNFIEEDSFSGRNSIGITFVEDSEELWLHGKDLTIQEINVQHEGRAIKDIEAIHYDQKEDVLIIKALKKDSSYLTFEKDHHYIVELIFEGKHKIDGYGFLKVASHFDSNNENINVLVTFFAPNGARWAFPCFDEPEFQPSLHLSILHHPNNLVAGNSRIKKQIPSLSDHFVTTEFEPSDKIPTHSIGLAVMTDYKKLSYPEFSINGKIPQSIFVPKDFKDYELVNKTLLEFVMAMDSLQQHLGIVPSMEKVDHIFINGYIPARIESRNLIMSMIKPINGLQSVTFLKNELIFKSAAYQFFGIESGPKYWSESWLSKGFSTFLATKIADWISPENQTSNGFNLLHCSNTGNRRYKSSITQTLDTDADILHIYNPDIEIMGTCFMMMVESFLGSNIFNKVLLEYYKVGTSNKHLNTLDETTFFEILQNVVDSSGVNQDKPVKKALHSWTSKKEYPFINITVNYDRQTVDIEQQNIYTWDPVKEFWIPLRFATIDEVSEDSFLMPPVEKVSIDFSSLKMNITLENCLYVDMKDRTLYSILYDLNNLKCLSSALQKQHGAIDPRNRAAIAKNAFEEFWYPDEEMFSVYKELLRYLDQEEDYYVWSFILYTFGDGKSNYNFERADPFLQEYIKILYKKMNISSFTMDLAPFERQGVRKLLEVISLLLGYRFEIPEALHRTKEIVLDVAQNGGDDGILNIMTYNCRIFENLSDSEFRSIKDFIIEKKEGVQIRLKNLQKCTKNEKHSEELKDLLKNYEKSMEPGNNY